MEQLDSAAANSHQVIEVVAVHRSGLQSLEMGVVALTGGNVQISRGPTGGGSLGGQTRLAMGMAGRGRSVFQADAMGQRSGVATQGGFLGGGMPQAGFPGGFGAPQGAFPQGFPGGGSQPGTPGSFPGGGPSMGGFPGGPPGRGGPPGAP